MSKHYRRYELLLPANFNDGSAVPAELTEQTVREIQERFGVVSAEPQQIEGQWQPDSVIYRDLNQRVFVDVPDTADNRRFFAEFKERLKERFQQRDVWIATFPIEVI